MRKPLEIELRFCRHCGTQFVVRGYLARTNRKKFCSRDCKHRGLSIHDSANPRMNTHDAAWLAGLFDGEGWISWPNPKCVSTFRIGIASTSRELLEKVQAVTGTGRLKERDRTNENHSRFYVWYCYSGNASTILRQILPWLIVKKASAEVVIGIKSADVAPLTNRGKAQKQRRRVNDQVAFT